MSEFGLLLVSEIAPLRRYALKLTHDKIQAEDLVQGCLLRALAKQSLWQPGTDLRRWLFTILHHQWINELRRRTRENKRLGDAERTLVPMPGPNPVARIFAREIDRAIDGLPEIHREVLRHIVLDDTPYPEAAALLHVPTGTIRSRLARARRKLRQFADGNTSGDIQRLAA